MAGDAREGEIRNIRLQGREISYLLRRSARRTLGITIDHRGLTLSIPLRATLREAEAMLQERAGWVLEKLDEWAERAPPPVVEVSDGLVFHLLGKPCRLNVIPGTGRGIFLEGAESRELRLPARPGADLRPLISRALQRYALGYFRGRVDEYMYVMRLDTPGLTDPDVRLTSARTRWGSCSRISGIRLNWRLIHLPQQLIDYVVAHETAHLLEMNHSARFWAVVESLYPDYPEARAALKDVQGYIPAWD
jgi:predicted metal-dependent hydrolase